MATPPTLALDKALTLLTRLAADSGTRPLSAVAADAGLPLSTAYRLVTTFERQGFLTRIRRGHYLAGPALLALGGAADLKQLLTQVGRPILRQLAKATDCAAHLGVFEGEMVTYLLKAGRRSDGLFTREGMQLEAYCSGIGKLLLAHLPAAEREAYLATGPFIRLTPTTIIDPDELRQELARIVAQGHSTDNGEIDAAIRCVAVPIRDGDGRVVAAVSISAGPEEADRLHACLPPLRDAVQALERRLFPEPPAGALSL